MPESLWKSYIDMEITLNNFDRVRELYQKLLNKTKHVKVWLSYARFESDTAHSPQLTRQVYSQATQHFKANEPDLKEERLLIFENWLRFENSELGDPEERSKVEARLPKRVKKRRRTKVVNQETGLEVTDENAGWEEYYDYLFPDDEKEQQKKSLKILELAHKWKKGAA